jgi:hypothetical protein
MTTDLRETLTEIRDGVAVPPIDHAAFEARVRHHRRRRRTAQAAVGALAVAVVAMATVAVPAVLHDDDRPPITTPAAEPGVPVVLDGHVQEVAADGTVTDTGMTGTPLGWLDGRVVVLDGHRLLGFGDGPIDDVAAAVVHPGGVTYELTSRQIVVATVDGEYASGGSGSLLAAMDTYYVDGNDLGAVIYSPSTQDLRHVTFGSDGASVDLQGAEAGGDIVVFVHDGGVEFYNSDGKRRGGFVGGTTGALSPDGATYAYAPSADELARGMTPGLARYDTTTKQVRRIPLADPAVDVAWSHGALYVVTEKAGERTLWQCDEQACDQLLTDPEGTLDLG